MRRSCAIALIVVIPALGSRGFGEIYWNSFDGPSIYDESPVHLVVNDLYLYTSPDAWVSGGIYFEQDVGILRSSPWGWMGDGFGWLCYPGVNSYFSWFASEIGFLGDANDLAGLPGFSGSLSDGVLNVQFIRADRDADGTPWDGIQMRLVVTSDSIGRLAFRVGTFDSSGAFEKTIYTAGITNGRVDWEQPIPGDLTFDGLVNEADLALVKANWGAAYPDNPIILGDLGSGDPSHDGAVNSVDLDILRANWTPTPPAAAVPEPGILVLLGLPLALAGSRRRTRGCLVQGPLGWEENGSVCMSEKGIRPPCFVLRLTARWHTGQKKVERCACTIRRMRPRPQIWHVSSVRP